MDKSLRHLEDDDFKNDIKDRLISSLLLTFMLFPIVTTLEKFLPFRFVEFLNSSLSKVLGLTKLILIISVEELDRIKQGLPSHERLLKALNDPSIPEPERSLERLETKAEQGENSGKDAGFHYVSLRFTFPITATLFTTGFTKNSGRLSRTPWSMSVEHPTLRPDWPPPFPYKTTSYRALWELVGVFGGGITY